VPDRFYRSRDPAVGLEEDQREFLGRARISLGLPTLFYASLRDPAVFAEVAGRPMNGTQRELVTVPGLSTFYVRAGTGYPGLFESGSDTAIQCVLISDLTRFEETMIAWYEWDEYRLQQVPLSDGRAAQVFIPDLDAIRREYGEFEIVPWSFERWRAESLEESIVNARDWMSQRPDDQTLAGAGFFASEAVSGRGESVVSRGCGE